MKHIQGQISRRASTDQPREHIYTKTAHSMKPRATCGQETLEPMSASIDPSSDIHRTNPRTIDESTSDGTQEHIRRQDPEHSASTDLNPGEHIHTRPGSASTDRTPEHIRTNPAHLWSASRHPTAHPDTIEEHIHGQQPWSASRPSTSNHQEVHPRTNPSSTSTDQIPECI